MNALRLLLPFLALLLPGPAAGASCTLLAAPVLDFGSYVAGAGPRDAEGVLQFSCVPDAVPGLGVPYRITLGPGSASAFHPRRLRFAGFGLAYNIYVDAVRTIVWGDGSANTVVVTGACGATCAVHAYGRIPAGQAVPEGQYRDDVLVTLDF